MKSMSRRELDRHDARIQGVLTRVYTDHGWEPVEDRTPLDELLAKEADLEFGPDAPDAPVGWPSDDNPRLTLRALKREEALLVADDVRTQLMEWIFGSGAHPFRVCQRVFGLAWARWRYLLGEMSGAQVAEMLGQGRAAFSALMGRLFGAETKAMYGEVVKVAGQKSAASAEVYAANAAEHCPRRQRDAEAGLDSDERARRRHQDSARRAVDVAAARMKHARDR